jgi:hypothetical protein
VSAAKPMDSAERAARYRTRRGQRPGHLHVALTPRQWRRIIHKERRQTQGYGYPGTKGYATPRQRAAKGAVQ